MAPSTAARPEAVAPARDTVPDGANLETLAGKYSPVVKVDEFDKSRSTMLQIGQWYIGGKRAQRLDTKCSNGEGEIDMLRLEKIELNGNVVYAVYVGYFGSTWIFVDDSPLEILADTAVIDLKPLFAPKREVSGGSVSESDSYEETPDGLRALATAHAIKSRISGKNGSCTSVWKPATIAGLRQFVAHEVPR
jgi:hypothetical protein